TGSLENASIGGFPVFSADVDTTVYTLSITHVFDTTLWGGTPAINVNIPYADAELIYKGPLANGTKDTEAGFGDIVVTPLVGRHSGFQHWGAGISIFAPTDVYYEATVDIPNREIDALSIGKNVWAIQPVMAGTHLNTDNSREFSGAASLLFSEKNDATSYQTAPQFTLEAAALQHLPSEWALGASGYIYQQLGDDSGAGARATEQALAQTA
ncbi:MAG: transporter, partial [Roseobacter sp.]